MVHVKNGKFISLHTFTVFSSIVPYTNILDQKVDEIRDGRQTNLVGFFRNGDG